MKTCSPYVRLGLALVFGLAAQALDGTGAATRYVAHDGHCANHAAAIGGAFSSCRDSKAAGCTAGQPCCTLQDGVDVATSAGDVVEIHDGVFSDPTAFTDLTGSFAFVGARFAVKLGTPGVTLRRAAGDSPTLDLGAKNHVGILIASSGETIDGLKITGGIGGTDTSRVAQILAAGEGGALLTDISIRNNTLEVGTSNHVGSVSGNACVKLDNTSGFLVEDNTCAGGWDFSFWVYYTFDGRGGVIRRNTQIGNGRGGVGSQRGMILEGLGNRDDGGALLVYGNTLQQAATSGATFGLYLREIHWATYVFDNFFTGINSVGVYFQDDLCTGEPPHYHVEKWYVFNNTFVGDPSRRTTGIRWPGCVQASATNNIFKNFTSGVELRSDCPVQICATRDDPPRNATNSAFGPALCWPSTDCVRLIGGNAVAQAGIITGVEPLLGDDGRLSSASVGAVDTGTSNPIGLGPGVCSVTADGMTADCTLDIDGRPRGLGNGWDLGASEALPPATTPPGNVSNLHRQDTRPNP